MIRVINNSMACSLYKITKFADQLLKTSSIKDYSGAMNGLQVENSGAVKKIVAAVDAHEAVLQKAVKARADLLIVHHGLFWGQPLPLTGANFRRIELCMKNNLAVYSSHLPLDLHPTIGNNAIIAKKLGIKKPKPFYEYAGESIGKMGELRVSRDALVSKVEFLTGHAVRLIAGGPSRVKRIGIVSGGGGDLAPAIKAGVDTYITGEGAHHTFGQALEYGINLIYAGHYATEVFGVQALAKTISQKFNIPSSFLDLPSGL